MKVALLLSSLLFLSQAASAQTSPVSQGALLLFQNTKSKLSPEEKNSIFKQLGFLVSADQKQFIADKEATDFPFSAFVYPTDLNKDGNEEIFILYGNSYTSGRTGSSIILFIKNIQGHYAPQLGFPGTLPDAIQMAGNNYPELVVGGPGFEFPVWKWKPNEYIYNRTISDTDLKKLKTENVQYLSKKYTDTLQ